jgi:hypothetical protein
MFGMYTNSHRPDTANGCAVNLVLFLDVPIWGLPCLDLSSLISSITTNRRVKSGFDDSALFRCRLVAQAVYDNSSRSTNITSNDRLIALQTRQTTFAELLPRSITTVQLDFPILNAYAFKSGGIFAVTEPMNKAVRWVALESTGQPVPGWKRLELDK